MKSTTAIDSQAFQRVLSRNVKLPLLGGLLGVVVFAALIFYLLSVIGWVEHTDQVTRNATEAQRLSVDLESSMRGFLITGEQRFLEPYEAAQSRIGAELTALRARVSDNPGQVARVDRITALQGNWNTYAGEMIALRRGGQPFAEAVIGGRGKALSDAMRSEYASFVNTEQALRFQRNNEASRTGLLVVGAYVLFTVLLTGLLAYFGRRQLTELSQNYQGALAEQTAHAEVLQ
ncbi:MAG: two-component system sensor histidine kinase/response regulator, partial [Comamonadaceae bacterium]